MKKGTGIMLIICFVALALIVVFVKSYSKLTKLNTEVINKESDINVQLSRKNTQIQSLIDNLLKNNYENKELIDNINKELDDFKKIDNIDLKCDKNNKISELINKIFESISKELLEKEELKDNINEIISTENRLNIAKNNYNNAVDDYNKKVKNFPSSIISNFRGFKEKNQFEIIEKINNVLEVEG